MNRCFLESLNHGGIMIIEEDGDVDVYDAVADDADDTKMI